MLNGPELFCRSANGRVALVARGGGVPAAAIRRHGWAVDGTGAGYSVEQGATPVPAGAVRYRGLAFTADGAIYTTNTAPAATATFIDGFAIRADGALHINTGAVSGNNGKKGANRDNGRVFA